MASIATESSPARSEEYLTTDSTVKEIYLSSASEAIEGPVDGPGDETQAEVKCYRCRATHRMLPAEILET